MIANTQSNEALQSAFEDFLNNVPAIRLKENMTKVLLAFLKHESPDGLPAFMDDHFIDLIFFFEFLDSVSAEVPRRRRTRSSSKLQGVMCCCPLCRLVSEGRRRRAKTSSGRPKH
ncbi:hypothetical protein [Puia dinghuensis]|uniref:hypothetical protein n=1 Tax=Puia dinghuensis TaxID=1792502 RepID=UPI00166414C4|nr:hypothetical protein [Puia dinghuensis]